MSHVCLFVSLLCDIYLCMYSQFGTNILYWSPCRDAMPVSCLIRHAPRIHTHTHIHTHTVHSLHKCEYLSCRYTTHSDTHTHTHTYTYIAHSLNKWEYLRCRLARVCLIRNAPRIQRERERHIHTYHIHTTNLMTYAAGWRGLAWSGMSPNTLLVVLSWPAACHTYSHCLAQMHINSYVWWQSHDGAVIVSSRLPCICLYILMHMPMYLGRGTMLLLSWPIGCHAYVYMSIYPNAYAYVSWQLHNAAVIVTSRLPYICLYILMHMHMSFNSYRMLLRSWPATCHIFLI